jgi:hypothetical protein
MGVIPAILISILILSGTISACCAINPLQLSSQAGDQGSSLQVESVVLVPGALSLSDPHIKFDNQGNLYIFWIQDGSLMHQMLPPHGNWSSAENLSGEVETLFHISDTKSVPCGQMCVFFEAATLSANPNTLGLYWRCKVAGEWSGLSEIYPHSEAPSGRSPHAPDCGGGGCVKVLHSSGNTPVYFGDTPLSSAEGTIHGLEFVIGEDHTHHALWQRLVDQNYLIEHRTSEDGGKTWAEVEVLKDLSSIFSTLKMNPGVNGDLHLVGWAGAEGLFYKHWSTESGWGAAERINGDFPSGSVGDLGVDADGWVHATWVDGNGEPYLVQGAHETGWEQPVPLSIDQAEVIRIAINNDGSRHFVWIAEGGGIYYGAVP